MQSGYDRKSNKSKELQDETGETVRETCFSPNSE